MQPNWRYVDVEVPITVTLNAYDILDVVGGTLTSDEIPQLAGGASLADVRLVDDTGQAEPFLLYVYTAAPSTIADGAAFAPTEADWLKTKGCIDIPASAYDTTGDDSMALVAAKDRKKAEFIDVPNLASGRLYFRLVAVDTPDYADANDLTLHVGMWVP